MTKIVELNFDYTQYYADNVDGEVFKRGQCIIRIYENEDYKSKRQAPVMRSYVIITEPLDLPPLMPSVTNAAEAIASAVVRNFAVDIETTYWIEHLPGTTQKLGGGRQKAWPDEFDLIQFDWDGNSVATNARWSDISQSEVEQLIGQPLNRRSTLAETQIQA